MAPSEPQRMSAYAGQSIATSIPIPPDVSENMTINRVQNIEKQIVDLRDAFESRLATVLISAMPPAPSNAVDDSPNNRTYLERSLTDVELAVAQLRRIAERIVL